MPVTVKTYPTLSEAASVLASDRGARLLAGGTLVMRALNEGDVTIETIVRSTDRALRDIRSTGTRIEIGAGVTMAQILGHRELAFLHPAARAVGGPAIRSMASVGGNLFAPCPYGDLTTALLACDATLTFSTGNSARDTPLEEFLIARERGQRNLVAAISLTRPASTDVVRFLKVSRVRPKGISVLTIAAVLPISGGRITGARVAYGALAPTPIRAKAVERALEGRALDEAGISGALAVALDGTSPASDAIASDWYRREVLPVHLRRALLGVAA